MSISINNDINSVMNRLNMTNASSAKADALESRLSGNLGDATDEELMDVCKSFESYLLEQVLTKVKSSVAPSEEDENDYVAMFGDQLYRSYAEQIADRGELGIAQKLYEAMKRDYGGTSLNDDKR